MPSRKLGEPRTPAEWAQRHAGIEFIQPPRDREMMERRAQGWNVDMLAQQYAIDPMEVERSLARTARTLITWERNACRWATHFVAVEPNGNYGDGSSQRDMKLERDQRGHEPTARLNGKRLS